MTDELMARWLRIVELPDDEQAAAIEREAAGDAALRARLHELLALDRHPQLDFLDRPLLREHDVSEIIHFAAKIVVPESVADPLGYYLNNTAMARSLIACAVAIARASSMSTTATVAPTSANAIDSRPRDVSTKKTRPLKTLSVPESC